MCLQALILVCRILRELAPRLVKVLLVFVSSMPNFTNVPFGQSLMQMAVTQWAALPLSIDLETLADRVICFPDYRKLDTFISLD